MNHPSHNLVPKDWLVAPVLPVVVADTPDDAVFVAECLQACGVAQIEITLRTPSAIESVRAVARRFPALRLAAGTVLAPAQIAPLRDAGAQLCVSPGFTPRLAEAMAQAGMPWVPGTASASEVMLATEAGYNTVKFFPAMTSGGPPALANIAAALRPARGGDLHFIPTGGIGLAHLAAWKAIPGVLGVGGSWFVPRDKIVARDRVALEELARAAVAAWAAA